MTTPNKTILLKLLLLIFIIISFVGIYQYALTIPSAARFIRLATVRNPETLTELYFENHLKLPSYVELDTDYPYAFTIRNLEHKNMNYRYQIYVDQEGKKLPIASGNVSIKDGESKTIKQNLLQHNAKGRVKVVVELIDLNQQIDFWIQTIWKK